MPAYEAWWGKVNVKDLITEVSILNSAIDPDPTKKSFKNLGKKTTDNGLVSYFKDEVIAEDPNNGPPSKRQAVSSSKATEANSNDSNNTNSDVDFKHRRRDDNDKILMEAKRQCLLDDLFSDLPPFPDNPTDLGGDFNLEDDLSSFFDDLPPCTEMLPVRKGKELSKMKELVPSSPSYIALLESARAAEAASESSKLSGRIASSSRNVNVSIPAEVTIIPESAIKKVLHSGLKISVGGLLKAVQDAALSDVESIAQEASFVYTRIQHLNGDPTRLRERVESYSAAVKALHCLEATYINQPGKIDKELMSEREGLEKDKHALSVVNEKCVALAERRYCIDKEIIDLQEKLKGIHASYNQLESDSKAGERSLIVAQDHVKAREIKISQLEVTPRLNGEQKIALEQQECLVLELQSSLDPNAWMDLVS